MYFIVLAASMALGTVAALLGEDNRHHLASTLPEPEASMPKVDSLALPQFTLAIETENLESEFDSVIKSNSPGFEIIRRDSPRAHMLIEDSISPEAEPRKYIQAQVTPVQNQNKNAVHANHPFSVPQMQSTMAPVEAAQTFRSFQSAQASVSSMSKLAAQKGPAGATMAAAAASASASLAKSRPGVEKGLMQACKGDSECKKYYKDGLKSGSAANKGHKVDMVNHGRGKSAGAAIGISTIMVTSSGLVAAFLLI